MSMEQIQKLIKTQLADARKLEHQIHGGRREPVTTQMCYSYSGKAIVCDAAESGVCGCD